MSTDIVGTSAPVSSAALHPVGGDGGPRAARAAIDDADSWTITFAVARLVLAVMIFRPGPARPAREGPALARPTCGPVLVVAGDADLCWADPRAVGDDLLDGLGELVVLEGVGDALRDAIQGRAGSDALLLVRLPCVPTEPAPRP